jgi:hypothetical protein
LVLFTKATRHSCPGKERRLGGAKTAWRLREFLRVVAAMVKSRP